MNNELMHHGILGMKWGIRRYQNPDGTLTKAGKKRYSKNVFVSGSSHTTDPSSPHHMKDLPSSFTDELDRYMAGNSRINIGDAPGVDSQVQDYLKSKNYKNVSVFSPADQPRYLADPTWQKEIVKVENAIENSKEWLAGKDIMMAKVSDVGLAIPHDNPESATWKNIKRLMEENKNVHVWNITDSGHIEEYKVY